MHIINLLFLFVKRLVIPQPLCKSFIKVLPPTLYYMRNSLVRNDHFIRHYIFSNALLNILVYFPYRMQLLYPFLLLLH